MKSFSISCVFIALNAAFVSCHVTHPRQATSPNVGYTGNNGPLAWGRIPGLGAQLCSTGRQQSPINIGDDPKVTPSSFRGIGLDLDYKNIRDTTFRNTGLVVEVNATLSGSTLKVYGAEYELDQFHFHTPSEHRLSEEYFPLEVHFVHTKKGDPTNRLVLGVVFELSENGATTQIVRDLMSVVKNIPSKGDVTNTGRLDLDRFSEKLDRSKVYAYNGSLTTPPCSEGVNWLVEAKPLPLDVASYNRAKNILKFNSRYTQAKLGERNLLDY